MTLLAHIHLCPTVSKSFVLPEVPVPSHPCECARKAAISIMYILKHPSLLLKLVMEPVNYWFSLSCLR
jgi:hypothetical protein